jgi:hypothetical protein
VRKKNMFRKEQNTLGEKHHPDEKTSSGKKEKHVPERAKHVRRKTSSGKIKIFQKEKNIFW